MKKNQFRKMRISRKIIKEKIPLTQQQMACASLIEESEFPFDAKNDEKDEFLAASIIEPMLRSSIQNTEIKTRKSSQVSPLIPNRVRKFSGIQSIEPLNNKFKSNKCSPTIKEKIPVNLTQYVLLDRNKMKTICTSGTENYGFPKQHFPKALHDFMKKRQLRASSATGKHRAERSNSLPNNKSRIIFL